MKNYAWKYIIDNKIWSVLNECPEAEIYIKDVVYLCIENLDMSEAENQILEAINEVRRCNAGQQKNKCLLSHTY